MENKLTSLKKVTNKSKINKNIKKFVVIFLARVFFMPKNLPRILRKKMKKNHDNWLKTKKVIQSQKMSEKCPQSSKFFI